MVQRTRFVVLTLSAIAATVLSGTAQQRPVFRSAVETVQVDVVVRDRAGEPVRGLTVDDFVVLDRGKPQQVVTFQAFRREQDATPSFASRFPLTTKLDVSSNQITDSRRLVVLVLDDLHAYRGRDDVVKRIARGVVERLGSDALIALLMTSGDYNVEMTEDRGRIMAAIDRFKGARLVRRPMWASDDRRGVGGGQPPGRGGGAYTPRTTGPDLQEFDANLRMFATMEQAARLFSASDGRRKAFVLVSESLAKDLTGVVQGQEVQPDVPEGSEAYVAGNFEAMNPTVPPRVNDLAILDALQSLRKSNVVTYAVDPRGQVATADMLRECQPAFGTDEDPCLGGIGGPQSITGWVRMAQTGLKQFAEASGGFAIVDSSDFERAVTRITDDLDNYYLLGFNTEDTRTQGFRRLEVQVRDRRDVQLRYRRGYEIGSKAAEAAPKEHLFGLSSGALPDAAVPLRMTAAMLPGAGRDARVHVAIEVSMRREQLEEADRTLRDDIQYGVTVVDLKGAKVKDATGYRAKFVLRPGGTNETPPDVAAYQVGLIMDLPPGRYQLRGAASSTKLSAGGSVYLPIDVPDFPGATFAVSSVIVGYGDGPHVPATMGMKGPTKRAPASVPAVGEAPPGLPFTPTLDREFTTADEVALYFEVARKDRKPEVALRVMAIDYSGYGVPVYENRLPSGSAGKVSVRIPLKNLGAGAFRFRVYASDGAHEATSDVPIRIR